MTVRKEEKRCVATSFKRTRADAGSCPLERTHFQFEPRACMPLRSHTARLSGEIYSLGPTSFGCRVSITIFITVIFVVAPSSFSLPRSLDAILFLYCGLSRLAKRTSSRNTPPSTWQLNGKWSTLGRRANTEWVPKVATNSDSWCTLNTREVACVSALSQRCDMGQLFTVIFFSCAKTQVWYLLISLRF